MRRIAPRLVLICSLVSLGGCGLFKKKNPDYATPQNYDASASANPYPADASGYQAPNSSESALSSYGSAGGTRYHTVGKKETLYSLARTYYNDQSKWRTIYEANRMDIGEDPNRIRVGQKLVIP
jgi:nucleoid-associated protein YgaU